MRTNKSKEDLIKEIYVDLQDMYFYGIDFSILSETYYPFNPEEITRIENVIEVKNEIKGTTHFIEIDDECYRIYRMNRDKKCFEHVMYEDFKQFKSVTTLKMSIVQDICEYM